MTDYQLILGVFKRAQIEHCVCEWEEGMIIETLPDREACTNGMEHTLICFFMFDARGKLVEVTPQAVDDDADQPDAPPLLN